MDNLVHGLVAYGAGLSISKDKSSNISATELIETVIALNIDKDDSSIPCTELIFNHQFDSDSFIVSDVDEELIILFEFKQLVELQSIKIFASLDIGDELDSSAPKTINIYKTDNLNKDFQDIQALKPHISVNCLSKKLLKGQKINCTKNRNFKKIRYLAMYIPSNQNNTEKTHINYIKFKAKPNKYETNKILIDNKIGPKKSINKINFHLKYDTKDDTCTQKWREMENECNNAQCTNSNMGACKYISEELEREHKNSECCLIQCSYLKSLINSMQQFDQYIKTQRNQNIDDRQLNNFEFSQQQLLNGFHHLLSVHGQQFEEIYNEFNTQCYDGNGCDLTDCLMMRRNHRNRSLFKTQDKELQLLYFGSENEEVVFQQICDKIHCHVFHSFDIGYKVSKYDKQEIIKTLNSDETKYDGGDLDTHDVSDKVVVAFNKLMYDRKQALSNIDGLNRLTCSNSKFITTMQSKAPEYSYGYRFFYWNYYKNHQGVMDLARQKGGSMFNLGEETNVGYTLGQLYVSARFKELKDELTNNPIYTINVTQWNNLFTKAKIHLSSDYIKAITCQCYEEHKSSFYGGGLQYYDNIEYKMPITVNHITAMMTYCNQDILQAEFSKTFRKIDSKQNIMSIISKHSNYANLAKLLRECVECFPPKMKNDDQFNYGLFHGISIQTNFDAVFAYIKTPVSTSTDFAVAINFTQNKGMILELGISTKAGHPEAKYLFDCQLISDFSNEQEIFFVGGCNNFIFHTIINVINANNYSIYVTSLQIIATECTGLKDSLKIANNKINLMIYMIMSDLLHTHYPDNEAYHKFESMPQYVRELVSHQIKDIKMFWLYGTATRTNEGGKSRLFVRKLFESIFYFDYGWIKLSVIGKVFPSLRFIKLGVASLLFLQNKSVYTSTLYALQHKLLPKLQQIWIELSGIEHDDHEVTEKSDLLKIKKMCLEFKPMFRKCGWTIGMGGSKDTVVEFSSLSYHKSQNMLLDRGEVYVPL
eukprot:495278_1